MSGGGGEGLISKVAGTSPLQSGRNSSMPAYGSSTPTRTTNDAGKYTPSYAPMQQNPQETVQDMGLEALYQSMASQYAPISQQFNSMDQFYQGPIQQQQMPSYGNSYKPDMSGISANLGRVAPSVSLQQKQAAEEAARQAAANPQPTYGGE
jgi:hypothetical protein